MTATTQKAPVAKMAIPFKVRLNLNNVIERWRSTITPKDANLQFINNSIAAYPFLSEAIEDLNQLDEHEEFLQRLFMPVLPGAGWTNALHFACSPFAHDMILVASEAYQKTFQGDHISIHPVDGQNRGMDARVLYAYKAILKKFYDFDIAVDQPIIMCSRNSHTGLMSYYKLRGNTRFIKISHIGPLPRLEQHTLQKLLDQDFDLDSWMAVLPPENFLFEGVTIATLVDITAEESTKRLQFSLLHPPDPDEVSWLDSIQQEIRNLLRLPKIRLGIATLQKDGKFNFTSTRGRWNSLLIRDLPEPMRKHIDKSFYHQVIHSRETVILENLKEQDSMPVTQVLVSRGYRNILLAPLCFDHKVIGILELASPDPGDINGLSLFKINQLKPIFANAMHRLQDEFENKVEAVMLEEFTAIHPSIQWRFREAAIQLIDKKHIHDPIVFENLHPFFGSLDIRDSSRKRNQAIYHDIRDNLEAAKDILQLSYEHTSLNILEELIFQIRQKADELDTQATAGDEVGLTDFIRHNVNPIIEHLGSSYPALSQPTAAYRQQLNQESGIFDRNRLRYEEALAHLNRRMSSVLETEEKDLQKLVPCYFDKIQTDGIEYNIYVGQSISPSFKFDHLYIENLRLRQLAWTCRIVHSVRSTSQNPITSNNSSLQNCEGICLQIAPLILAYGGQINLSFQPDKKRLDVAGTHNLRYEIIKKRIDKAVVKNTEERLTQPDHIAIVYSRTQEAQAYRQHIAYLIAQGLMEPEFEELELEPMQGVRGLKAIRVKVKPGTPGPTSSSTE